MRVVGWVFLGAAIYSLALLFSRDFYADQVITIAYCCFCTAIFWRLAGLAKRSFLCPGERPRQLFLGLKEPDMAFVVLLLLTCCAQQGGLLLSFYLVDSPADRLWVVDSFHMHLPGALNVVNVLDGKESFRILQNSLDRPYATHIFVGFFFWLFGVTPVVSGVALLVPKLGVVFFTFLIGRKLFSSFVGAMAAASYVLLPTITYYTVVFYKESFVQLFVVASFFYLLRLRLERFAILNLLFFLMSTVLLANERFYLFPLFILAGLWAVLRNRLLSPRRRVLLAFGSLGFVGAYLYYFSDQIHFASIIGVLNRYRGEYNAYSDVDHRWNVDLPYPIGIFKLYFTPYFTLRKFSMFSEFSLLLIWGSFLNQILLLGSLAGLFLQYRVRGALRSLDDYGYLLLPVVGFLAVFGYVAPFAGRLRDGFVPLLLVFSASALSSCLLRQKKASRLRC